MNIINYMKRLRSLNYKSVSTKIFNSIYARLTPVWNPMPKCREITVENHIYNMLMKKYGDCDDVRGGGIREIYSIRGTSDLVMLATRLSEYAAIV